MNNTWPERHRFERHRWELQKLWYEYIRPRGSLRPVPACKDAALLAWLYKSAKSIGTNSVQANWLAALGFEEHWKENQIRLYWSASTLPSFISLPGSYMRSTMYTWGGSRIVGIPKGESSTNFTSFHALVYSPRFKLQAIPILSDSTYGRK